MTLGWRGIVLKMSQNSVYIIRWDDILLSDFEKLKEGLRMSNEHGISQSGNNRGFPPTA